MTTTTITPTPPAVDIANDFRSLGIVYWQKLIREGVPKEEASQIAKAIAKFELFAQIPSTEQKQLISQFSALLCRAQLWRSDLLL